MSSFQLPAQNQKSHVYKNSGELAQKRRKLVKMNWGKWEGRKGIRWCWWEWMKDYLGRLLLLAYNLLKSFSFWICCDGQGSFGFFLHQYPSLWPFPPPSSLYVVAFWILTACCILSWTASIYIVLRRRQKEMRQMGKRELGITKGEKL